MADAPKSYFVIDPGRSSGFAYCMAGGSGLKHGIWRFRQEAYGAAYHDFAGVLRRLLSSLPDPQLALEQATIVSHNGNVDARQVVFTAGWYAIAYTICHNMGLREPEMIAIGTWRSKTHGKTQVPKELKETLRTQSARTKWFKQQAKDYCEKNGWSYRNDDEAEALCMLDALRIIHEPDYAFDKGRSYRQEALI